MKTTHIITASPGVYGQDNGRFRCFYAVRSGKVLAITRDQLHAHWSVNMCVVPQAEASHTWKGVRLQADDALTLVNQIRGSLDSVEALVEELIGS